jgi:putative ABC transport system permease protein
MRPMILVRVLLLRNRWLTLSFILLTAVAVAIGLAITTQERALRKSAARAAEPFDIIVAAPGSHTDVLLSSVFLRTRTLELLPPHVMSKVMAHPAVAFAAPMGFGDNWEGHPVVGTTADLVRRVARGEALQGRMFVAHGEAIVGAAVPLTIGQTFAAEHGTGHDEHDVGGDHGTSFEVVGKLPPTGTPWDKAVIIPIEAMWEQHGLPTGHPKGSEQIGAPFDPAHLPGVPLIVVEPKTLADAYGLRSLFRTNASTAFFPAETLVSLFPYLADIRALMSVMATGTQVLVFGCVLLSLLILLGTHRPLFATLRALGAPRRYVLLVVWLTATIVVATGCLLGLALGQGLSVLVSRSVAAQTSLILSPLFGWPEVVTTLLLIMLAALLALVPALSLYRIPAAEALRQ